MDKVKFVILVLILTVAAYIVMLPVWSVITTSAFATATSINGTANAEIHRFTIGALRFAPLALFFAPGGIGLALIAWKLKISRKND